MIAKNLRKDKRSVDKLISIFSAVISLCVFALSLLTYIDDKKIVAPTGQSSGTTKFK